MVILKLAAALPFNYAISTLLDCPT